MEMENDIKKECIEKKYQVASNLIDNFEKKLDLNALIFLNFIFISVVYISIHYLTDYWFIKPFIILYFIMIGFYDYYRYVYYTEIKKKYIKFYKKTGLNKKKICTNLINNRIQNQKLNGEEIIYHCILSDNIPIIYVPSFDNNLMSRYVLNSDISIENKKSIRTVFKKFTISEVMMSLSYQNILFWSKDNTNIICIFTKINNNQLNDIILSEKTRFIKL